MAVTTARRKAHAPSAQQQVAQRRIQAKQQGASLPAYLQRKLSLGQVGDAYEVEADHVADQVVAAGNASPALESGPTAQRVPADEKKQDAKKPDEKKPDEKAQKAEADKKDAKKPDEKKDQKPTAQKAEADKKDAKKPDEKKDQKPAVQKKEVNADAKIADEKKKLGPGAESKATDHSAAAEHDSPAHQDKPDATQKPESVQKADAGKPGEQKKKDEKPATAQKQPLASGITRVQAQSLQTKADAGGSVPGDVEHRIDATRGGGAPLPANTRGEMESQFGTDFGNVNIHTGSEAQSLSSDLNAKAFTVGNDVYFNNGAFAPETQEGKHLLAHELTHVVQQGGASAGVQRLAVQCGPKGGGKGTGKAPTDIGDGKVENDTFTSPTLGSITKDKKTVHIKKAKFPEVKKGMSPVSDIKLSDKKRKDNPTNQMSTWEGATKPGVAAKFAQTFKGKSFKNSKKEDIYALKIGDSNRHLVGKAETIADQAARPTWDRKGGFKIFQIDHQHEIQLGGSDSLGNLWLLTNYLNMPSGLAIDKEINQQLATLTRAAKDTQLWDKVPSYDSYRYGNDVYVDSADYSGEPKKAGETEQYSKEDILAGEQFKPLKPLTAKQAEKAGLKGSPEEMLLFSSKAGGEKVEINVSGSQGTLAGKPRWLTGIEALSISMNNDGSGTMKAQLGSSRKGDKSVFDDKKKPKVDLDIKAMDGVDYAGYLDVSGVRSALSAFKIKGWSPVEFGDVELGPDGLSLRGVITVSVGALQGATIDLIINGDEIKVAKTFRAEEFKIPGPFKITAADLTCEVGTNGLAATGGVDFAIEKVGKGRIAATASMKAGGTVSLSGEFNFDPKLVDEGKVTAKYENGKFSGTGNLGIKEGRIKGIKSASASVNVDGPKWDAKGSVEPDVPGIDHGDLSIAFDPDKGMTVGGDLFLKKMPGITDGKLSAELQETGDRWKLKASGTVNLAIPDLPASITATYDDGAFTASLTVAYAKGMLKGSLVVGLTNQAVGDDGKPAGDPGKDLTVFGSGSMTIQVAPWLQGTVAITLLPTGKLKVYGEVALPSTLDVFPEKRFDKELLSIGIDIPIVGVSVAGQRVGIFATIGGNVKLMAGVGPGQLRNVKLGIDYTPGEEDKTHVTGSAEMHVPADAGLRLAITGGIGAGIPIVSATAGLEIGAFAGVKAEANVGTTVDWTPTKGLVLEGKAEAKAQPAFAFDVTGFVKVEADLLVKTINLYEKRWQLAAFEYGSGMELGIELPLRYEEGKPFNPSIEDVKFTYPDIDPMGMLGGLIDKL
jgi:Domain of unknown function (DUF4157)